jgi:hypothetical protein
MAFKYGMGFAKGIYMIKMYFFSFYLITLFFLSWNGEKKPLGQFFDDLSINYSDIFLGPISVGKIKNPALDEVSGMAFSFKNKGGIYVHNDSGGGPYVYIIDSLGNDLGMIVLPGVINRDWEEMAIGPSADSNTPYIYMADIGDNNGEYTDIKLHRFLEPDNINGQFSIKAESFSLKYPDGPKDAETLLIDPILKEIFIISKRGKMNDIYKISIKDLENGVKILEKVGNISISMLVGGDISVDGKQILLKNYSNVFYWQRQNNEPIEESLKRKPHTLPYDPEPQGEAISFHPSGNFYYTLSEKRFGIVPVLYRYDKKQTKTG